MNTLLLFLVVIFSCMVISFSTASNSSTTELTSTSATDIPTTMSTVTSTTTATPPPTTTIPIGTKIDFTVLLDKVYNTSFLQTTIANAVGEGCNPIDVRILFLNSNQNRNATIIFYGAQPAQYAHRFLYSILEVDPASVFVVSFTFTAETVPNGDDNKDNGVDTKKVAIAGGCLGALILIVLGCGLKSGKIKSCCGRDKGSEDERRTFESPRGTEMPYASDDNMGKYSRV